PGGMSRLVGVWARPTVDDPSLAAAMLEDVVDMVAGMEQVEGAIVAAGPAEAAAARAVAWPGMQVLLVGPDAAPVDRLGRPAWPPTCRTTSTGCGRRRRRAGCTSDPAGTASARPPTSRGSIPVSKAGTPPAPGSPLSDLADRSSRGDRRRPRHAVRAVATA